MSSAERHVCPPDHKHGATTTCYFNHRCRCFACCLNGSQRNAVLRREHTAGVYRLVPIGPALEHVTKLRAAGLGPLQIAALANLSSAVVTNLIYMPAVSDRGQVRRIRVDCEAKILSVPVDPMLAKDGARIPKRGTARRLQALCALGWPGTWLAGMLGTTQANFSRLLRPEGLVTGATARSVADLYDRLAARLPEPATGAQRGAVARAKRHAEKQRWARPFEWDDIDSDRRPASRSTSRAGVDEIAVELAMEGERVRLNPAERIEAIRGLVRRQRNDGEIAALIGIDIRSVLRIRQENNIAAAVGADRRPAA